MDKIEKFLNRLNKDTRAVIKSVILQIISGNLSNIKCKKLKGFDSLYSTRKGQVRIIFSKKLNQNEIVNVDHRKDVYKDL